MKSACRVLLLRCCRELLHGGAAASGAFNLHALSDVCCNVIHGAGVERDVVEARVGGRGASGKGESATFAATLRTR